MNVIKHQWQMAIGTSTIAIRKIWMTLFKAQIILKFHKYRINWKSTYSFVLFPNSAVPLAHVSPMMYNNYNERVCRGVGQIQWKQVQKYCNILQGKLSFFSFPPLVHCIWNILP